MDALTMLAAAVIGWVFAIFVRIDATKEAAEVRKDHAAEIERKDARIDQLLDQVQLNTQHLPYYPTIGPAPAPEPDTKRYYGDESGFLVLGEDELADALNELDRLAD